MKKQVAQFVPYTDMLGDKKDITGMSPVAVGNDGKLYYDKYAKKQPEDEYFYVNATEPNLSHPYSDIVKVVSGEFVDQDTPSMAAYFTASEMKIGDKLHVIYENASLGEIIAGNTFTLDIICEKTSEYHNGTEHCYGFSGHYVTPIGTDSMANTVSISNQFNFSVGYKPDDTYVAIFPVIGDIPA